MYVGPIYFSSYRRIKNDSKFWNSNYPLVSEKRQR